MKKQTLADKLTRRHTAFRTFTSMIRAKGGYRPSLYACPDDKRDPMRPREIRVLAYLYDRAQVARGDTRRAFRADF